MRITVHVLGPIGGRVLEASLEGTETPFQQLEYRNHPVAALTVDIPPGAERELAFDVITGPDQPEQVSLRVTPGANGAGIGKVGRSSCA